MSHKSRANDAHKRRRVEKEMRRVVEEARNGSSSDDDFGNAPPAPVPAHVLANNSRTTLRSRSSSPINSETQDTTVPCPSPLTSRKKSKRQMRGRRLLYGQQRGNILLSDDTSANDESFSDNAAGNGDAYDVSTDLENDNAFEARPVSSSGLSGPNESDEVENEGLTFRERIALYVTKHSLSLPATAELLEIFKSAGVQGLPKDRRALLSTSRGISGIVDKCGGKFKYFGLKGALLDFLQNNPTFVPADNTIYFCVNIDGVPLYKSSSGQFWPLLCQVGKVSPFIVAMYFGEKKPDNIGDYLEEFLEEYVQLCQLGIIYQGNQYNVRLRCWICDAPARCLLKCIKGHTGYYACERCKAVGVYMNHKITYPPNLIYESRKDDLFAAMAYHNAQDGDTHQTGEHCCRCPIELCVRCHC